MSVEALYQQKSRLITKGAVPTKVGFQCLPTTILISFSRDITITVVSIVD